MAHPATKKRGGDPDVKHKPLHEKPDDAMERKLEEGLEESMAGSDPVSITQPSRARSTSSRRGTKKRSTLSDQPGFAQKPAIWPAFAWLPPHSVTI